MVKHTSDCIQVIVKYTSDCVQDKITDIKSVSVKISTCVIQAKLIHSCYVLIFQAPLVILLVIIVVWHLPPRIVIMTGNLVATVPWFGKAPGGTALATIPT